MKNNKCRLLGKYTHSLPQSVLQNPTITPLEFKGNAWNHLTSLRLDMVTNAINNFTPSSQNPSIGPNSIRLRFSHFTSSQGKLVES